VTHTPFAPDVDERYVITRFVDLPSPVERVWRAVSDADEIARWFPNRSATLDLEPGGTGLFIWDGHGPFTIVVEALDEPHYLAWSWGHEPGATATTLVEWRLAATETGTRLTVTESGIRTPDHFTENSEGWDEELAQLVELLTSSSVS
jgi:uncharacterized protein YndB with AHSA1/START domain